MIQVREPTVLDMEAILADVRFADMAEWFAGTGALMHQTVPDALSTSEVARVALDEEGPLCMWGASGGRLWLFAANRAEAKAWSLHKVLKPNLYELHDRYGDLHCIADARNAKHLRWLSWLGFEELGEVDLPPFNLTFKVFTKDP